MFRHIASTIEQRGDRLASEWLADLERRGNVLAAEENRPQLWHDAKNWITLLLRAMRTDDIEPLRRACRLTAHRLAVGGFAAADAVETIISFKSTLWHVLSDVPDRDSEPVREAMRRLGEWLDGMVLGMVEHFGSPGQGEAPRSMIVDRAKHLSRIAEEQSIISHLTQEMAAERNAKRLLGLIVRSAAHLAGAQQAALVVPQGESLRYRAAYRMALTDLNSYVRRTGTPLSGSLESPKPGVVRDLEQGPEAARARAARKLKVRTALRAPMEVGGRMIGLLELFDPLAGQDWTERDVSLVQDLATQAALAMENARLLAETEQRAEELTALNEVGRELASELNSPRLCARSAASAARVLRASSALLWLRAAGGRRFELQAAHGRIESTGKLDFELGKGPLGRAASGEAAIVSPAASREMPWGRGWAIIAPLRIGLRTMGLLAVHRGQRAFGEDDARMLEALAGQVVVAVQNAQLYEESRRLTQRLNVSITGLGEAMAAALDMHELLQVITDQGVELADATAAIIFLDEHGGGLVARAVTARDGGDGAAADPQAYEGLAALAVESGESVALSDCDEASCEDARQALRRERIKAGWAFPLTVKGRPAGALCILKRERALRSQERELLSSFSLQAAVGIENVILFHETQQRLAELADLSRASAGVSATLDQTVISQIIVDSITRALRAPVAAMALVDAGGELHVPDGAHRGLPPGFARRFAARRDSIARSVIEDQRIKVINDIAAERRAEDPLIEGLNLCSIICAPLNGREGVLGVVFAADHAPRTFRPHEEALMSAYANEAALALQNALHYQAVAGHARELEGLLDATKTLSSTLELQPVLDHVARAAASLLGVPICSIMLTDGPDECLRTVAACGLPREHGLHADLRAGESIPVMVASQGAPMSSTALPRDGRFKHREVARAEGLLSALSVPLSVKGKTLGVISAYSRAGQPFTAAQERLLDTLAAEASVAMENARLYAEAREQASSMRLLMEEVNHRIKNNLQSIIGIIQLHVAQVEEPRVQEALREIIGRVQAIAVVHELLLDEDVRAVDVKETSRRILDNALRANPNPRLKILGQVTGARVRLPSRKATPLASVVNELVYNSLMHAFPGREQGTVGISLLEATGGKVLVQVSDDGVGLPNGFDIERGAKLGLRIVEGIVTQDLDGEFTIASDVGTIARVTFEK